MFRLLCVLTVLVGLLVVPGVGFEDVSADHNNVNQTWALAQTVGTDLPFPTDTITSNYTHLTLSANPYNNGIQADMHSTHTQWTLQPTNTILQCRAAIAAIPKSTRQPRSPQGRTLGYYLNYVISQIEALPGYATDPSLPTAVSRLTAVADQLAAGTAYAQLRTQLRSAISNATLALGVYHGQAAGAGTFIALERLLSLVEVLWDATAALTDTGLSNGVLDDCIAAVQPLPN